MIRVSPPPVAVFTSEPLPSMLCASLANAVITYQNSLNADAPVVNGPSLITVSPAGRITSSKHRLVRLVCVRKPRESYAALARLAVAGRSESSSAPSSERPNRSSA